MKPTDFLIALVLGLAVGGAINSAATDAASAEVYTVCNSARLEISGTSEEKCGDLQDRYQIEFICTDNNNSPANHCWTEAKR